MNALTFTVHTRLNIEVIEEGSVYLAACAALLLDPRTPVTQLNKLEKTLDTPSAAVKSLIQPECLVSSLPGIRHSRPEVWVETEEAHMEN